MTEEKKNKRDIIRKGYNASQSTKTREKREEFGYNQRGSINARVVQENSLRTQKHPRSTKKEIKK